VCLRRLGAYRSVDQRAEAFPKAGESGGKAEVSTVGPSVRLTAREELPVLDGNVGSADRLPLSEAMKGWTACLASRGSTVLFGWEVFPAAVG
jgi:hypothetical protein